MKIYTTVTVFHFPVGCRVTWHWLEGVVVRIDHNNCCSWLRITKVLQPDVAGFRAIGSIISVPFNQGAEISSLADIMMNKVNNGNANDLVLTKYKPNVVRNRRI